MKENKGITTKKEEDMAEWYSQVCLKAELADYGITKGTFILRPNGYAIWQIIQEWFNKNIVEATKCKNAYFPLFIPESFFQKEAEHAKGFKPEVAWLDKEVTGEGERLAIRPTSETIMYNSYSQWIRSHRDLPLRINQWANVVRWETEATKLFLRSREFLWQEGHNAYETEEECRKETINYIELYKKLCEELLAMPVIVGKKTAKERFAGAKETYAIEAFMPDGKALQCGTSHELGQDFAKAFKIEFIGKDEKKHFVWQNSWGLSTRLIGGMVFTHSDNKGLVLPPNAAENKCVIIPIYKEKDKEKVVTKAKEINEKLISFKPIIDDREGYTPGWKYNEWEMRGIPLRIEIGPKDIEKKQAVIVRRDTREKKFVDLKDIEKEVKKEIKDMQESMYKKAKKFLETAIIEIKNWKEFEKYSKEKKLMKVMFCGEIECEDYIKEKTAGVKSRCIIGKGKGKCVHCEKEAKYETYFSKSY